MEGLVTYTTGKSSFSDSFSSLSLLLLILMLKTLSSSEWVWNKWVLYILESIQTQISEGTAQDKIETKNGDIQSSLRYFALQSALM